MAENVALVRRPSSRMADGITTHIDRVAADAALAARQHEAYVDAVAGCGWTVREVAPDDDLPDCAFVEDTVVMLGDLAVLTQPGADERRAEVAATEEVVRSLGLEVARIEDPGTLDGGDVLQVGRTLYVGRGGRTNAGGVRQLRRQAARTGRTAPPVKLRGGLPPKSAGAGPPGETVLA